MNTGKAGTLDGAVDAENFSGYNPTQTPIRVIVQDGKQLALENLTVDIAGKFLTKEIVEAYNYGYTSDKRCLTQSNGKLLNEHWGPNGPFQVAQDDIYSRDKVPFFENIGIKSMKIGKNDIIYEAGYFVNGKDVSNSVLNMLEWSRLNLGPINFTMEGKEIDVRWTQLPRVNNPGKLVYNDQPGAVVTLYSLDYLGWLSKDLFELKKNGVTYKIGKEVTIVFPANLAGIFNYAPGKGWQPSPEAPKYMLDEYNIVLDQQPVIQSYPLEQMVSVGVIIAPIMRVLGGWQRGK